MANLELRNDTTNLPYTIYRYIQSFKEKHKHPSKAMRHVFVKPYNPPFPDPRKWGLGHTTTGWMQGYCHSSFQAYNIAQSQNDELLTSSEQANHLNNEDLNEEWELEMNDEWAERFAATLENMRKRRREQLSESKDENDSVPKGKRRKTKRKKHQPKQ